MNPGTVIIGGLLKLLVIISLPLAVLFGFLTLYTPPSSIPQTTTEPTSNTQLLSEPTIILKIPLATRQWTDIGSVVEPVVQIPVQTANGFEKNEFVVDSGAVISSLPRDWAEKTGRDLALAKRISFRGFGNTISFAYQSDMLIRLGNENVSLPVVFTESAGTRSLLGRKGFFDQYSIVFNHTDRSMEIRK